MTSPRPHFARRFRFRPQKWVVSYWFTEFFEKYKHVPCLTVSVEASLPCTDPPNVWCAISLHGRISKIRARQSTLNYAGYSYGRGQWVPIGDARPASGFPFGRSHHPPGPRSTRQGSAPRAPRSASEPACLRRGRPPEARLRAVRSATAPRRRARRRSAASMLALCMMPSKKLTYGNKIALTITLRAVPLHGQCEVARTPRTRSSACRNLVCPHDGARRRSSPGIARTPYRTRH